MKNYQSKLRTAEESIDLIRSGQRVFIGSSCGEPQHLVNALMDNADYFSDVEIVRLLSLEGSLIALMADESSGSQIQCALDLPGLRSNQKPAGQQTIHHAHDPLCRSRLIQKQNVAP